MLKAVIIGTKVLCGKCGALLFYLKHIDGLVNIEIKCKHREQGENCNEVNQVEL